MQEIKNLVYGVILMLRHHGTGVIKVKTEVQGRQVFTATPAATFFINLGVSILTAVTAP